jgi:hypothetical protein
MSSTATGTFEVRWDPSPPYDTEPGAQIARASVSKTFRGDLTGTSTAELITAMTGVPDSAGYVGMERVTGAIGGRAGTFVLQHAGLSSARTGQTLTVDVVPDSATGELAGLRGSMQIDQSDGEHTYTLTYAFET